MPKAPIANAPVEAERHRLDGVSPPWVSQERPGRPTEMKFDRDHNEAFLLDSASNRLRQRDYLKFLDKPT
jgi:hypothetical protein